MTGTTRFHFKIINIYIFIYINTQGKFASLLNPFAKEKGSELNETFIYEKSRVEVERVGSSPELPCWKRKFVVRGCAITDRLNVRHSLLVPDSDSHLKKVFFGGSHSATYS